MCFFAHHKNFNCSLRKKDMAECDLCGKRDNLVRARIDGVLLNVCRNCAKSGTIVEPIKPIKIKRVFASKTESEELIVPDFNQKIRIARQKNGLKQEELASKINEKLSVISSVESGKRMPDLKLAKKLERFFGITLIEKE